MQGKKLIEENEMYSMVLWCKRWAVSVRNKFSQHEPVHVADIVPAPCLVKGGYAQNAVQKWVL